MGRFLRKNTWSLYLTLCIIYSELLLKRWCMGLDFKSVVFTVLLSVIIGSFFTLLCTIRPGRFFRAAMGVLLFLAALLYSTQAVYYRIFKAFLLLSYMGQAGDALSNFWREALTGIWRSAPIILAFFAPLLIWLLIGMNLTPKKIRRYARIRLAAVFALLELSASLLIASSSSGIRSVDYLYNDAFVPEMSMRYFGALTVFKQDIIYNLKGGGGGTEEALLPDAALTQAVEERQSKKEDETVTQADSGEAGTSETPTQESLDTSPNVTDIDFDSLILSTSDGTLQTTHRYFSSVTPTNKNEYTGVFEGYNLIWICAEGFSGYCLDETHLPTLWKLAHEGFVFSNFYNPYWYFSTADGEYTFQNALLPISADKSVYTAMNNYLPYGMGNVLNPLGYSSYGFHAHTSVYYSRDISMPNLGYEFYANDTGLQIADTWPESDVDMISSSLPYYITRAPFNIYYMTMSGHMNYTFDGNAMAARHQDEVQDLPYSEEVKAYIACMMETDDALALLLERLEGAGQLENTVIVLSGDHYPYDLDPYFTSGATGLAELMGVTQIDPLDKFHSSLILWNAAMAREEPVQVDTLCCQLDVLPTLLNMFGVEYDSRLLMGRDIFADGPRTVVFRDHSYITDYGRYDASTDTFTAAEGVFASEDAANSYAVTELDAVDTMFEMSENVLEYDYYSIVLKK